MYNTSDRWIRQTAALAGAVHSRGFLQAAEARGLLETVPDEPDESASADDLEIIIAMIYHTAPGEAAEGHDAALDEVSAVETEVDMVLELGVTPNVLEFDKEELRAFAGQTVQINFTNTDNMEHNLLIIMPGSLAEVGRLADQMMASPQGRRLAYVPDTEAVIAATPILDPGESYELIFTVPDQPGEYGFVCTIPGHWRIMNGILVIE
jgi:plastocyanin